MSSINLRFHALPEELVSTLQQWIAEQEPFVVLMYLAPSFKLLSLANQEAFIKALENLGVPWRVCLGLTPPRTASTMYDFMIRNQNWCVIDIGEVTLEGLRESQMSLSTDDPTEFKFWSKLAKNIKKITVAGLWGINPNNGQKQFYRQNRYSRGAAELSKSGKKLLPVAGWTYYQIEA